MARPRKDPNAPSTRQRIRAAARAAFARSGFTGARLADIARAVGIRRPSLLHHFPTKDALYREVVETAFADLGAAMAVPLLADGAYRDRLEALARAFAGFLEDHPDVARLILLELVAEGGPGQAILVGQVAPLLDRVEAFVIAHGGDRIAPGVRAREALLHIASDTVLRTAAGPVRAPVWGPPNPDLAWAATRALLWTEER